MLMKRDPKHKLLASLLVASALCVLSSCATSSTDSTEASSDPATTDAMILDESNNVGATPVDDSGAFADLEVTNDTTAAASTSEAGSDTFYNAVGGESLRRVALTLYSDKSFASKLMEKNPELKAAQKLSAEQKVYFDMSAARPNPRYLTKDLLDRYAAPLAEKIAAHAGATTTTKINTGESLQDVSKRLYGTSRYWTELYLVNHDKIKNYDRVPVGLELTVLNRENVAQAQPVAKPTPTFVNEDQPSVTEQPETEVAAKVAPMVSPQSALPIQPAPAPEPAPEPAPVAEAAQVPPDPIPETPPAPPPAAVAPPTAPAAQMDVPETGSSNSNLRRILYIVLIVSIGGAAFYFTRTPKRPKVDMLDLNADASPRPKLPTADTQKHNIG